MLAFIPLVLAAALLGNPVFTDAQARFRADKPEEAVPLLISLLGQPDLTDAERAEVQIWLATCHTAAGDAARARGHLVRAVALDPQVQAPAEAPAGLKAQLEELRPKEPVPWLESPQGILTTTAAGTAGVAVLLAALVATDLVVTNVWLDQWYDGLESSQAAADPRSYVEFIGLQNKRYSRVRENNRADVAVLVASGVVVLGSGALALAAALAPVGEAE